MGYEQLTGTRPDLLEVHNLRDGVAERQPVAAVVLSGTVSRIRNAGMRLRANDLPRLDAWCDTCDRCHVAAVCRGKPALAT